MCIFGCNGNNVLYDLHMELSLVFFFLLESKIAQQHRDITICLPGSLSSQATGFLTVYFININKLQKSPAYTTLSVNHNLPWYYY